MDCERFRWRLARIGDNAPQKEPIKIQTEKREKKKERERER
jgi:hypothetical protein